MWTEFKRGFWAFWRLLFDAGFRKRVEEYVLTSLRERPKYGLEVQRDVFLASGGEVFLGQGSVYPMLRDLESDGLLLSFEEGSPEVLADRGGRPRRYYTLTEEGRRQIEAAANGVVLVVPGAPVVPVGGEPRSERR